MLAPAGTDLRLAEPIASISLATDLGMGQADARRHLLPLLEHTACTADAYETSLYVGGEKMIFRKAAARVPFGARRQLLPLLSG